MVAKTGGARQAREIGAGSERVLPRPRDEPIGRTPPLVTSPAGREADGALRLLAVYGVFVLLVLLYTWPLVLHPGAHLRRFFDVHYFVWVFGWIARRRLVNGSSE
jgi:hypothetical protein